LAGWISILVRTGLFEGGTNDTLDPATYVVDSMQEAFNLIIEKEGLIEL